MLSITGYLDSLIDLLNFYLRFLIYSALLFIMIFFAKKKRLLTLDGTITALALGYGFLYLGGLSAYLMLLFFFLTASLLSKAIGGHNKIEEKGSERDLYQVLANGGPAFLFLLLSALTQNSIIFLVGFASALAEAEADTFAGDIGYLSHKDPVSIITFTKVPKGLSGGVTMLGFLGAFLGAILIAMLFVGTYYLSLPAFFIIIISGFFGALFDSVLGATIQVHYRDESGKLTEHKYGKDGLINERVRGIPIINNDAVNALSGLFAATLGSALIYFII